MFTNSSQTIHALVLADRYRAKALYVPPNSPPADASNFDSGAKCCQAISPFLSWIAEIISPSALEANASASNKEMPTQRALTEDPRPRAVATPIRMPV